MELLFFGDQTANQLPLLRKLLKNKHNSILSAFLLQTSRALRHEVNKLPWSRRSRTPDFLTVGDLVEAYSEHTLVTLELETALVTIAQLSHYIVYRSEQAPTLEHIPDSRVLGLCTGLLAATAVSSVRSLSELVPLAVETVKVAFRIGFRAAIVADSIEQNDRDKATWASIVTNTSETDLNQAIEQFSKESGTQAAHVPYVSAVSGQSLTLSGPPSTISQFFESVQSKNSGQRFSLPIYAPYHARHLFSEESLSQVLDDETRRALSWYKPVHKIYSSSSGDLFTATDTTELIQKAVEEIFWHQVRWDCLLDNVVTDVGSAGHSSCIVASMGATNMANSLVSSLKAGGHQVDIISDDSSLQLGSMLEGADLKTDKIAIVGMSGRFPSAANHEELWNLLMRGIDTHREIPPDRFDAEAHVNPSGKDKNKSHTPYGCFIDQPGLFDPRFFNMSPREAAQTDPMGRLAIVTAYEALEMSGYVPGRTPSTKGHRIGTFYGQTSDDWREVNAAENIDTYWVTGGVRAFAPGRINYYFKFSGPSFSIDTACSSSLAAIQLACTSLWAGDCDTACAGGLNVLGNPDVFAGLSKGQFLSKTGNCKTFDNDADGYCRGDGCGTVILKRYSDAIADNDNILGSILSTGTNHSAQAVSITHPHAGAQETLYKKVLADAGVDAHEIQYVEMHGTGTQAGDGTEMTSVTEVFAPRDRQRKNDLYLGAIKANVGHGEAASGINSLIKVLLMMQKNSIPPNVGIKGEMNKGFPADLKQRKVHIPTEVVAMPRIGSNKRKIFLNNFSAAGGNTALLLEDGPLREDAPTSDPRTHHIVTVSARAISSLQKNIEKLIVYLRETPGVTLPSLSYTTTARRIQHNYRIAICVSDMSQVQDALSNRIKGSYSPVAITPTPVAFTFTGQGSQYRGIAQALYQDMLSFKTEIDRLDKIATFQDLPSFLPLITGEAEVQELSPVVVQVGLSCIQVALARMWISWGVKPVAVIGHSLGEYAALHIAGVISISDMIHLVGRRSQLLVSACTEYTHAMLAVKSDETDIQTALGSDMIEIACRNSNQETVLCGTKETIESTNEKLTAQRFKATLLEVPFAFHSAQIDPILEDFTSVARSVVCKDPEIPVLSAAKSEVLQKGNDFNAEYFARHARDPVNFQAALEAGLQNGAVTNKTAWLEIGAHPICSGLVKAAVGSESVAVGSLKRNEDAWKTITESIRALYNAGVAINFDEYHREFNAAHELLTLPTYQFDNKNYWLDYHNNWTLTKGEAPTDAEDVDEQPSKLSTTSCQRIVEEDLQANTGTVVIRSDLTEPKLAQAVTGHLVNGSALLPSSLYADQALTIVNYLYEQLRPGAPAVGLNVCDMEVSKPLIAKVPPPSEGQFLEIEAEIDLEVAEAQLKYRSVSSTGDLIQEHGHCTVMIEDVDKWQEQWSMTSYMVQTQVDILKRKLENGGAHSVLRGVAYKLFKALVDYDEKYRGMEEVIIDGKETEATASVSFQTKESDGEFFCSPYWIDSLCHIAGFICNGTDLIDSDENVYVSHGWSTMRFAKTFSPEKEYRSYVRMLPKEDNIRAGDVYIMEGEEIVGVVGGIKFQQIPRRVLNTFLPPIQKQNKPTTQASAPVASAKRDSSAAPSAKSLKSSSSSLRSARSSKLNSAAASAKSSKQSSVAPTPAESPKLKPSKSPPAEASKTKPKSGTSGSTVSKFMSILQEETDVSMSELIDEVAFDDLGVDSLLSLTISARLREELDLEIPQNLFSDITTVGAMKAHFAQFDTVEAEPASSSSSEAPETSSSSQSVADGASTPAESNSTPPSSPPSSVAADDKADLDIESQPKALQLDAEDVSIARSIIAKEMEMAPDSIPDNADLSEFGMDSLMSLNILSELREQTGIELPSEFLTVNTTLEDIENALGQRPKKTKAPEKKKDDDAAASKQSSSEKKTRDKKDISNSPKADSVLLQGNAKTSEKKLFLFPDGSGSATSYVSIPNIDPSVAVYGLNCPFMKTPRDFSVGIAGVASIYINEVKRRQPAGPYYLGGWSAGGVIAYEVAYQLLKAGEDVAKLLLIDSPCPVALEPLPARLHEFFDEIGLLGPDGKNSSPDWLLPHFESSIKALDEYTPTPIPSAQVPSTFAIWAREGVCGKPDDPKPPPPAEGEDPKPMKWLLENRTEFGDNGWAELLGSDSMRFAEMDGNHFTMMTGENASTLGKLLKQGLED